MNKLHTFFFVVFVSMASESFSMEAEGSGAGGAGPAGTQDATPELYAQVVVTLSAVQLRHLMQAVCTAHLLLTGPLSRSSEEDLQEYDVRRNGRRAIEKLIKFNRFCCTRGRRGRTELAIMQRRLMIAFSKSLGIRGLETFFEVHDRESGHRPFGGKDEFRIFAQEASKEKIVQFGFAGTPDPGSTPLFYETADTFTFPEQSGLESYTKGVARLYSVWWHLKRNPEFKFFLSKQPEVKMDRGHVPAFPSNHGGVMRCARQIRAYMDSTPQRRRMRGIWSSQFFSAMADLIESRIIEETRWFSELALRQCVQSQLLVITQLRRKLARAQGATSFAVHHVPLDEAREKLVERIRAQQDEIGRLRRELETVGGSLAHPASTTIERLQYVMHQREGASGRPRSNSI